MRTRRRKIKNKRTRKNNKLTLNQLLEEYQDVLVELETKKRKFYIEHNECQKWKKLSNAFFSLKQKKYPIFNAKIYHMAQSHENVEKAIKDIKDDIVKITKEWKYVHSICLVCNRRYLGLLHTIPSKKIVMIKSIYPDIEDEMEMSRRKIQNIPSMISRSIEPKKVKFNTFVFAKKT